MPINTKNIKYMYSVMQIIIIIIVIIIIIIIIMNFYSAIPSVHSILQKYV